MDPEAKTIDLLLHERKNYEGFVEEYIDNSNGEDWDLGMRISSKEGKECDVNALNKWCGFSEHVQEVEKDEKGFERIMIKKFTESYYMVYLK